MPEKHIQTKVAFDYDAQRRERREITKALHAYLDGAGFDDLVTDRAKLRISLPSLFGDRSDLSTEQADAVLGCILSDLRGAVSDLDWRAGYGRTRKNATVPEAASCLMFAAIDLIKSASCNTTMTTYRNRHQTFVEAMAEFAEQANGGLRANMTFYQRLGETVAQSALEHKLGHFEDQPQLAPDGIDHRAIEVAATEQLVYFIQCGESGPIKIGIAKDPKNRLSSLQTGHHEDLTIKAITSGGADQEREYHARFKAYQKRGEWFAPHPDILAEIARLTTTDKGNE